MDCLFLAEYSPSALLRETWLAPEAASLPASDRGALFGDGLFETVRVEGGVPIGIAAHEERLRRGCAALGLACPPFDIGAVVRECAARAGARSGMVRLTLTRGSGGAGYACPDAPVHRLFAAFRPLPSPRLALKPVRLWVSSSCRKIPPVCLPTHAKTLQGMSSVLALREAKRHGSDDALLLTPSGYVAESASANLFFLSRGTLRTPCLSTGALPGTTRALVMALSPYPVEEGLFRLGELAGADAVFLTNASYLLRPVARIAPRARFVYDPARAARPVNLFRRLLALDIQREISGYGSLD
jgi:branched-subunit amino acid aminotransferase/4-amino-4-deoxychorismate lyase